MPQKKKLYSARLHDYRGFWFMFLFLNHSARLEEYYHVLGVVWESSFVEKDIDVLCFPRRGSLLIFEDQGSWQQ
jgi:hypothetical protein